jgi:hypothetical protein
MVGLAESDERGTMSSGHNRTAEPTVSMMTADRLRLTAYGQRMAV